MRRSSTKDTQVTCANTYQMKAQTKSHLNEESNLIRIEIELNQQEQAGSQT